MASIPIHAKLTLYKSLRIDFFSSSLAWRKPCQDGCQAADQGHRVRWSHNTWRGDARGSFGAPLPRVRSIRKKRSGHLLDGRVVGLVAHRFLVVDDRTLPLLQLHLARRAP